MTGPVQNAYIIKTDIYAIIGTDAENDKQHFKIQLARCSLLQGLLGLILYESAGFKVDGSIFQKVAWIIQLENCVIYTDDGPGS